MPTYGVTWTRFIRMSGSTTLDLPDDDEGPIYDILLETGAEFEEFDDEDIMIDSVDLITEGED